METGHAAASFDTVVPLDPLRQADRHSQTLPVKATYRLSEEGRKASLLAGGDGRAVQEVTMQVPTNRMHLVGVDDDGAARLKLSPRYVLNSNQQVLRSDRPPIFDTVPTIDDLLKEAGRNHQLERAWRIEQAEHKQKQQDTKFEVHQQIAQEFLNDPTRRAHEYPRPTPRQCAVTARNRIVLFDAKRDTGVARHVPPEAYRRFCADVTDRKQRNLDISRRETALRRDRAQFIDRWVATHGTADQQERHAAGMLPIREVLNALADEYFATAADRPRYVYDGQQRLTAYLQQFPQYGHVVVTRRDLRVTTAHADHATEAQWAVVQELKTLFPDDEVQLQVHHLSWARDEHAPWLTMYGVLVKTRVGPFLLLREYLAPTANASAASDGASMAVFDKVP
jgi:hypothetical protein